MYRVTLQANYCSAELRFENSDIWNCSPWLDMYHKCIDRISNDLWYRMVAKELKQQCCYSVSCTRTWLCSLLCDEKRCKLQLGLAALCLHCFQRTSPRASVPLNCSRSIADKNNKASGASRPTRLHCGVPLVEDLLIIWPSLPIMVNNLVRCEQPLSAMVVVMDTCPHLDLDTAHDIPVEALRLLAFCTDGNDYSVPP